MELISVSLIFIAAMVGSLIINISMVYPLLLGLFLFGYLANKKGFSFKDILKMIKASFKDSFIVIEILLLIGCLTGIWRISGTITYFISLGVSLIPKNIFILAVFILTAIMSFALGTSFGVSATAGVILMSIGRAGGVNPIVVAGAVMSGVYIGDRGSPAASSGNLVAVLTHTNMNENVKTMAKDSFLTIIICFIIYGLLSIFYPMTNIDNSLLDLLNNSYNPSIIALLPAIIMVVLPLLKVSIKKSMITSILVSIIVASFVQGIDIRTILETMIFGYKSLNPDLANMLNGGGLSSMIEVCLILLISGTYGSIFKTTNLLKDLDKVTIKISNSIGRFTTNVIYAIIVCGIFCNQTIGIIMQNQLIDPLYNESENNNKMLDIEDSVVLIAGLVPWCIACSVPLSMLGVGSSAIPYACYLYLLPLIRIIKEKIH